MHTFSYSHTVRDEKRLIFSKNALRSSETLQCSSVQCLQNVCQRYRNKFEVSFSPHNSSANELLLTVRRKAYPTLVCLHPIYLIYNYAEHIRLYKRFRFMHHSTTKVSVACRKNGSNGGSDFWLGFVRILRGRYRNILPVSFGPHSIAFCLFSVFGHHTDLNFGQDFGYVTTGDLVDRRPTHVIVWLWQLSGNRPAEARFVTARIHLGE